MYNDEMWGEGTFGDVGDNPFFSEVYLRRFITDMGQVQASDKSPELMYTKFYTIATSALAYELPYLPSNIYPVFVFVNVLLLQDNVGYTYSNGTVTLTDDAINAGDTLIIVYWREL